MDPNDINGHRTLEWASCFVCLPLLDMSHTDYSQRLIWNHPRWGRIQMTSHIGSISPHREEWIQITPIDIVVHLESVRLFICLRYLSHQDHRTAHMEPPSQGMDPDDTNGHR